MIAESIEAAAKVTRATCDRVAAGRLVEEAAVWQLFATPRSSEARALLQIEALGLPADLAARLSSTAFPGALRLVELHCDGLSPVHLPPGRWLARGVQRIQGHDVGRLVMAVPPEAALPPGTEVLGYVAADV